MSATTTIPIKITLKAGGERTRVTPAEAKQILKRFQATVKKTQRRFSSSSSNGSTSNVTVIVSKLDLSCRAWGPDAIAIIRPFLQQIASTLEILKIDDIIASLETDVGLQTLQNLSDIFSTSATSLQEINLNDNALGTRGLKVLQSLLSLSTLSRIYLHNCGISKEAAQESLRVCLLGHSLTHIALGMNQLGPDGAVCLGEILASNTAPLEYFNYKGSRPLPTGTYGLLHGLSQTDTSQLLHLDLNDVDFTTSLDLLSQVLQNSPKLQGLVLRDGKLEKAGLRRVLQALRTSRVQLQHLDLGAMFSDDNDDGMQHVEIAIELGAFLATQWSTLQVLVLGDNEWCNAGILALIHASGALFTSPEHVVLRKLNLETCNLSGSDVLHVLACNPIPTMQELILTDNMDLTSGPTLDMLQKEVYSMDIVKIDPDLEEEEEEEDEEDDDEEYENGADDDDADVDDLAAELAQGAHIAE